ncbi:MAG: hypothetical protein R2771_02300 [Saprospiraceae bacterium]
MDSTTQLYATMPKYVLRMVGEGATPSWYANVNPLVVVLTVAFVTQMMKSKSPFQYDYWYVHNATFQH